jgi:phage gp36-like protein
MSYATYEDILLEVDLITLIRLTDDNDLGEPDQAVVEQMIAKAKERVNAKVSMRYHIPLAEPLPGALKGWTVDLAMYYLFGRRAETPGDVWKDRYSRTEADLDKVATGRLTLGLDDPQGAGNRQPVLFSSNRSVFTRDAMGGF